MARELKQYRYYGENSIRNYPMLENNTITADTLQTGSIFFVDTNLGVITQLGIQTMPGIKFYLNGNISPIIIGKNGIFDLNVENISQITALQFDKESINRLNATPNSYLLVDAIYEKEEN